MVSNPRFRMTISLNVLNHLGLNLYSNVPSVLSEVIANSWDADARNVHITIKPDAECVEIMDDGIGMDVDDINDKYLNVGYERRAKGESFSQILHRPVMGRKGIGKLSLFSIARTVEVHSLKNGERCSFRMQLEEIRRQILNGNGEYTPQEIGSDQTLRGTSGTLIRITDFKRKLLQTETFLRKRLARRFSIIGQEHDFAVTVNETPITVSDRDYFHKLQYIWTYGNKGVALVGRDIHPGRSFPRGNTVDSQEEIWGWIGTVEKSGTLKEDGENINRITILVRGKLAQEDILEDFGESGVYAQYLIGEINADFLDADELEDIATSSRQRIIEDDPRYRALRTFVGSELKAIQNQWTGIRNEDGLKQAQQIPVVAEWYRSLPREYRESATRLFGKINQLPIDNEFDRRTIMKNSILAFESLRYKQNLQKLDEVSVDDLPLIADIFAEYDDIEATLYHQIVRERVAIIRMLMEKVEESAKEKIIQDHIFTHLWLLDKSWERVETTEFMERRVTTEFGKIDANLTDKQRRGRFDIKYRTTANKHVVIELKKPNEVVSTTELLEQIEKYRSTLRMILEETNRASEAMEFICIVGRGLSDWGDPWHPQQREESRLILTAKDARVVMYQELVDSALREYSEYLEKHQEAGRVHKLIQELEEWEPDLSDPE